MAQRCAMFPLKRSAMDHRSRPPFTVFVCSRVSRTLFPWKKRCTTLQALLAWLARNAVSFFVVQESAYPFNFSSSLELTAAQCGIHSTAHLHFLRVVIGLWSPFFQLMSHQCSPLGANAHVRGQNLLTSSGIYQELMKDPPYFDSIVGVRIASIGPVSRKLT